MKHLPFVWYEASPLSAQLVKPVVQASLVTAIYRPHSLTLWRTDGTGLRVCSRMHDIAERIEIGVLEFALVSKQGEDEIQIDFAPSFRSHNRITKLIVSQSGATAESGIVITASDDREILIVAGVYPYSLAVRGVFFLPHIFEPEYMLECYRREEFAE